MTAPTALVRPEAALHESWAAAMTEMRAEGEHVNGSGVRILDERHRWDLTEAGCQRLVHRLREAIHEPDPPLEHRVACHYFWITQDVQVIGFLALRTRLNEWLLNAGGHIGYSIVPSRRRRGHALAALALGVRRAAELGIDRVLICCEEANVASARTIERGGGVYEDSRNGKRRYWIDAFATPL